MTVTGDSHVLSGSRLSHDCEVVNHTDVLDLVIDNKQITIHNEYDSKCVTKEK